MNGKFDPFVAEWTSFATNPKYNLVEKCLKLSQLLEYPSLNFNDYIQKLNDIGRSLQLSINNVSNPTYRISLLNEHLFHNYGFKGDVGDYYNPKNNFLNDVIEKKSGIPITLSILYVEVAKHIGLDLKIVGFPSHVIVKYNEEIIVDPYNQGKVLTIDDLNEILFRNYGSKVEFLPEFLNELRPEHVLIRMLRNLKNSYTHSYAYDKAMRCTNMVLSLAPNMPEDVRDKGILEHYLLNNNEALKFLNRYLELEPNAQDADFVLELIRSIREKINQ